eukprot:GHVR01173174.1.p2 GENE.GHVR01173174.1~~GHVR01173174.1.p2  ORF type:complete len:105 (+),score=13.51 GHVR01173174.1:331-645(+)
MLAGKYYNPICCDLWSYFYPTSTHTLCGVAKALTHIYTAYKLNVFFVRFFLYYECFYFFYLSHTEAHTHRLYIYSYIHKYVFLDVCVCVSQCNPFWDDLWIPSV